MKLRRKDDWIALALLGYVVVGNMIAAWLIF
jgi:hypothetical protein